MNFDKNPSDHPFSDFWIFKTWFVLEPLTKLKAGMLIVQEKTSNILPTGVYPSNFTNVRFWKKIEFLLYFVKKMVTNLILQWK